MMVNGLNKATPLILLPVLTRLLDTDGMGALASFQSYYDFLIIIVGTSSTIFIQQKYFKVNKPQMADYITNIIIYQVLTALIVLMCVIIAINPIIYIFKIDYTILMASVLIGLLFQMTVVTYSLLQVMKRTLLYGSFILLQTITNISVSYILLTNGYDWKSRVYGIAAALILNSLLSIYFLHKSNYLQMLLINRKTIGEIYRKSIQYFPIDLISWVRKNINKLLILGYFGASSLGSYYVVLMIGSAAAYLLTSLVQGLRPFVLSDLSENKMKNIYKYLYVAVTSSIMLVLLFYFLKPYIMHYVLNNKYIIDPVLYLMILFMVSLDPIIKLMLTVLLYYEKNIRLSKITTTIYIIFIMSAYPMVIYYGIKGIVANSIFMSLTVLLIYLKEILYEGKNSRSVL